MFRSLVSDHRSHYSTRVLRVDTYRQVGEQKSPWIGEIEDPGQVRETLLLLLAVDTFRVFALHNIHSLEFVCLYRNELSRDAW